MKYSAIKCTRLRSPYNLPGRPREDVESLHYSLIPKIRWSRLRTGRFNSGQEIRYLLYWRLGGPQGGPGRMWGHTREEHDPSAQKLTAGLYPESETNPMYTLAQYFFKTQFNILPRCLVINWIQVMFNNLFQRFHTILTHEWPGVRQEVQHGDLHVPPILTLVTSVRCLSLTQYSRAIDPTCQNLATHRALLTSTRAAHFLTASTHEISFFTFWNAEQLLNTRPQTTIFLLTKKKNTNKIHNLNFIKINNKITFSVISGFRRGANEIFGLLNCYAAYRFVVPYWRFGTAYRNVGKELPIYAT